MSPEEVLCLMVTGKDSTREKLAQRSIESFLEQHYPQRRLLILNDGSYDLSVSDPRVTVKRVPDPETGRNSLRELRNRALDLAGSAPWICWWHDDDWHHPTFLTYLMAYRCPDSAVVPAYQLEYDIATNGAFVASDTDRGFCESALHPGSIARLTSEDGRIDSDFLQRASRGVVLLDNAPETYPGPALLIHWNHGRNTWLRRNPDGSKLTTCSPGVWVLSNDQKWYLARTLPRYGLQVAVSPKSS